MIAVVIDTNAVHSHPWLKNEPGTALLDLADQGKCELVFPQVVLDELRRQQHDWVESRRREVKQLVGKLRGNPVNVDATIDSLEQSITDLGSQVESSFDDLLSRTGVETEPVPTDVTARLVTRDLARQRPFLEVGSDNWSTGFRDAVIWETILDVLSRLSADAKLIFVTADKGFLSEDKKELHPELLADLDAREIARHRITNVKTTFQAKSQVESLFAATAEAAVHADLVRIATDALYALNGQNISQQTVYGGDYNYPDFVKFQVPPMESQEIVAIDQITEFIFEDAIDGTINGSAAVGLSIEGATFKGDYLVESEGILELIGELNNHYFETVATVEARAVVEIENCRATGKYTIKSIALEDL